jgi:hypothetical protein
MLKSKDKYGLHHNVCTLLLYAKKKKETKIILDPHDNNDDVVH